MQMMRIVSTVPVREVAHRGGRGCGEAPLGVSDNDAVIEREKKRIWWRFQQQLGLALMRAQASMIFNYALATTRAQYITALPRGRRAANSRARGRAAGRAGASGGRTPAPRAGHGR
jgi:hypothetical protein